ncbi:hypothetical protein [Piscinibacter sakaiensis]|uniref:hypothetical protein n=1 Tax=Piscinibacter sakaiensis TaxID=1547922 RepID=UPI003AAA44D6
MAEFFKTSTIWVVDFRYKGKARRWFKAFAPDADVKRLVGEELDQLYGRDVQIVELRRATDEEELQYLRDELPVQSFCPTGR